MGIGAITWEEANIQATIAALVIAPKYILPVNWNSQVDSGITTISTPMIWKRLMIKLTNIPPGPTRGMNPFINRGTYWMARKATRGRTNVRILIPDQCSQVLTGELFAAGRI